MDDFAKELEKLHRLTGVDFVRQLKMLTERGEFYLYESNIYIAGGENAEDFPNLLSAARKAADYGYKVFLLPNPKGIRTADFIFEQKGIYKMYDLKTIHGKASALNRLMESMGQTRHVLLNVATDYNGTALARSIKKYFERNANAVEVLIFKGNKVMSITRKTLSDHRFVSTFSKIYYK